MPTPRIQLRAALAATAAIGLLGLTGCGSDLAPAAGSPSASASAAAPSAETSASQTPTPVPSEPPASATPTPAVAEPTPKLDWGGPLAPGAFGTIEAKGNVRTLVDRGWVTRDTEREKVCEGTYWRWVDQVGDGVDITFDPQGEIASFGMSKPVLQTAEGVTIGDTLMVLKDVYGMGAQKTNDYGQTTWVVRDGNRWLGFLLSGKSRSSKVEFIEVSVGDQPGLLRDGC